GPCSCAWRPMRAGRGCPCTCTRTCSGIPSPRTCWNPATTCAGSRSCWGTPIWPQRRFTLTLISSTWPIFTTRRTPAPAAADVAAAETPPGYPMTERFDPHSTTILAVRRDGKIALGGDGQVTLGNTVMKGNARKVRRLYDGKVLAGFAGGTADAFTLFERFEG